MICKIAAVVCLAVVGVICCLLGIFSPQITRTIIHRKLSQRLPLVNGSATVERWSKLKVPVYMKYTIFNITNGKEVLNGAEPRFEEKGPYVFREVVNKEVIGWNDDETLISYRNKKSYFFEQSLSNGSLSDNVTFPNLPLIGLSTVAMNKINAMWWLKRNTAKLAFTTLVDYLEEQPIVTHTVGELLFDGYKSTILASIKNLTETVNIDVANIPKDGKFCLMRGKNNSADGVFTVDTGKHDLSEIGSIYSWKNMSHLDCWSGDDCNEIKGTDGMMYHPFLSEDETIYLFSSDIRRSVYGRFEKYSQVREIDTLKFVIPKDLFTAPKKSVDNACFCVTKAEDGEKDFCSIDGILDMSKCLGGAPIVMSLPHFYFGDDQLINETIGMNPVKEKHENFMEIDPVTGVLLSVARRLQLNLNIKESFGLSVLEKMKKTIYPIAWFEETMTMDAETTGALKSILHDQISLMKKVMYGIAIFGLVLTIVAIILIIKFVIDEKKANEANKAKNNYSYSGLKQKDESLDNKININNH